MESKTAALSAQLPVLGWAATLFAHSCEADEELDYLTADAAQLFDAPIAMINLVANDKLIFKSCVGNKKGASIDRKGSFCSLAATRKSMLYVPDTLKDARFKNYQLVTGTAGVRAYLGTPLTAPDGSVIGTFCIMDTKPRKFGKQQLNLLTVMAASAETQLAQLLNQQG